MLYGVIMSMPKDDYRRVFSEVLSSKYPSLLDQKNTDVDNFASNIKHSNVKVGDNTPDFGSHNSSFTLNVSLLDSKLQGIANGDDVIDDEIKQETLNFLKFQTMLHARVYKEGLRLKDLSLASAQDWENISTDPKDPNFNVKIYQYSLYRKLSNSSNENERLQILGQLINETEALRGFSDEYVYDFERVKRITGHLNNVIFTGDNERKNTFFTLDGVRVKHLISEEEKKNRQEDELNQHVKININDQHFIKNLLYNLHKD